MDTLEHVFYIVMGGLYGLSFVFGTTYKIVNIICYFYVVPAGFIYLLSKRTHLLINLIPLGGLIYFLNTDSFEKDCNTLFDKCVVFLNKSAELFDSNYIDMSVYLCVLVPSLVLLVTCLMTLSKKCNIFIFSSVILSILVYQYLFFDKVQELLKPFLDLV